MEKVELIVLGGTWTFYPETYQTWFITRCFDAMNDFGVVPWAALDDRDERSFAFEAIEASVDGRATGGGTAYNGDEVVLVGEQGTERIRIEDLARHAGTVPHEILTSINTRVSRVYVG